MPTVLIVEDEILIRDMISEELIEAGFAVVEVGSADEAIAVLEARQNIHLVFTDIDMPSLSSPVYWFAAEALKLYSIECPRVHAS
jgi:CheY-like chemotaxis protein